MIINTYLYDEHTDLEVEAQLTIHYTPARKGNGVGSFYGPTPDEEENIILESVEVDGVLLDGDSQMFIWVNDFDFLSDLIQQEV